MADRSRLALAAALAAVLIALGGLTYVWLSAERPGGGTRGNTTVELTPLRTGLPWPIALAFAADGRVFYAERYTGNIQILGNATAPTTTFFTIPDIAGSGEQGFLGLALDPDFPNSAYVYAYYTRADRANSSTYNRIVRIPATGAVGTGMEILRDHIAANTFHNSGVVAFGPDGKLYALVGDAENSASAQDRSTPNGKVLRLNPNGSIASDNPFVGSADSDPDVYTYGHRNMFGIAWHPTTHHAYVTENGPQDSDEVNLLVPGGNYGWPNVRGVARTAPYLDPIIAYTPVIVPTNAAFYTAPVPAGSRDHLIVGGFNDHRLHELALNPEDAASVVNETILATAPDGILDVEMGRDGYLWVTTPSAIYRLVPVPAVTGPYLFPMHFEWFALMGLTRTERLHGLRRPETGRTAHHPGSLSRGRDVSANRCPRTGSQTTRGSGNPWFECSIRGRSWRASAGSRRSSKRT